MNTEAENPSHQDDRSTTPYNADEVRTPEMLQNLQESHPKFKGDWSQLERLERYLDAAVVRPGLQPEERLNEWNLWVTQAVQDGENIHLEGASLWKVNLQGVNLWGAHLEGANLGEAHLEGANLWVAHLEGVALHRAHLEGANLSGAHLEGAVLRRAHLEGANLSEAHLEGANLTEAHLEGAFLGRARLEGANLREAHLEKARLQTAHLEGANLRGAHLEGAHLWGAHLEKARLWGAHLERTFMAEAVLDQADVRRATGLRFNANSVFRVRIEGSAKDPWSMLRRNYTGPWFFVHLLLLVAFFTPYTAKFLYLSALSRAQDYVIERAQVIESQTEDFERQLAQMASEHENAAPWLPRLAQVVSEQRQARGAALRDDLSNRFRPTSAAWVLVGWTDGLWAFGMALIVVIYNLCRGLLTLRVSALRDAEERSQVTPRLAEYWPLYRIHRYASRLLYIALAVTAFNVGYWVWTTTVYVPTEIPQTPAASQPAEAAEVTYGWHKQAASHMECLNLGALPRDADRGST